MMATNDNNMNQKMTSIIKFLLLPESNSKLLCWISKGQLYVPGLVRWINWRGNPRLFTLGSHGLIGI